MFQLSMNGSRRVSCLIISGGKDIQPCGCLFAQKGKKNMKRRDFMKLFAGLSLSDFGVRDNGPTCKWGDLYVQADVRNNSSIIRYGTSPGYLTSWDWVNWQDKTDRCRSLIPFERGILWVGTVHVYQLHYLESPRPPCFSPSRIDWPWI